MQHTLIAVFDKRADAQAAMDELLLSSFSRQDVRLSEDSMKTSTNENIQQALREKGHNNPFSSSLILPRPT